MRAAWASVVIAAAVAFAGACGTGDSSPAPTASVATPQPATATGAVPTETATTVPSPSVTPPPAASVPLPAAPFDDATGPVAMLVSYYDAVNRHDFARAYAYLRNPAVGEPAFAAGYAGTVLAVPILRPASGIDAAAGNRRMVVAAVIANPYAGRFSQDLSGIVAFNWASTSVNGQRSSATSPRSSRETKPAAMRPRRAFGTVSLAL